MGSAPALAAASGIHQDRIGQFTYGRK